MPRSNSIVLVFAVAFIVAGLLLTLTLFASGVPTSETPRTSTVSASANLGVYSDSACTRSLTSIGWGTVAADGSVSRTFYLKNLGSRSLVLSLLTVNWSPTIAKSLMVVNWNREGVTLAEGRVVSVTLTLSASSGASGFTSFAFDVVISGSSYRNYA